MSIFINEITASDAGPDIIRSHLFQIRAFISVTYVFAFVCLYWIVFVQNHIVIYFIAFILLIVLLLCYLLCNSFAILKNIYTLLVT